MTDKDTIAREQYILELEARIAQLELENKRLLNSEEKFTTIFYKNSSAMVITRFEDGLIFDINDCAADIIGQKREDLLGKNIKELGIWGESFKREVLIEKLRNGYDLEFETKYIKKTGEMGTVLAKVDIMELDAINYALISGVDITERKQTEEALRASEDKFYKSFHQSGTMQAIARISDGVLLDVNESYASTFGFRREEVIGKTALELGMWKDPSKSLSMQEELLLNGCTRNSEYEFRTKSGQVGTVISNVDLIDIDGEECILVSSNNITKLKQYEGEIARLDNLKLMGQMAGAIAHEIRNPMTTIKGFLQLFNEQYKYRDDREAIDLMIEELDRVNDIITTVESV